MWIAWAITITTTGLMTTVYADSPRGRLIGFEILVGVGTGVLASALSFPILAPPSVELHSQAFALYTFFCSFSYTSSSPH